MYNDKGQATVALNWHTKGSWYSKLHGHKGNVHTKGAKNDISQKIKWLWP